MAVDPSVTITMMSGLDEKSTQSTVKCAIVSGGGDLRILDFYIYGLWNVFIIYYYYLYNLSSPLA